VGVLLSYPEMLEREQEEALRVCGLQLLVYEALSCKCRESKRKLKLQVQREQEEALCER
jgi:hypothetical protein